MVVRWKFRHFPIAHHPLKYSKDLVDKEWQCPGFAEALEKIIDDIFKEELKCLENKQCASVSFLKSTKIFKLSRKSITNCPKHKVNKQSLKNNPSLQKICHSKISLTDHMHCSALNLNVLNGQGWGILHMPILDGGVYQILSWNYTEQNSCLIRRWNPLNRWSFCEPSNAFYIK